MIIVDTSVWIDYVNGKFSQETDNLDDMLVNQEILLRNLIVTEVLQGFQEDRHFHEAQTMLNNFPIPSILGPQLAI